MGSGFWPRPISNGMNKKVVIIDYGLGNIASVKKGFKRLGVEAIVSDQPSDIATADALVLPGVGAFGDGMQNLKQKGLIEILEKKVLQEKTPFIGLCLGMQLLASKSYEFGEYQGLGWIAGEVVKITGPADLRLPHVGWNEVEPAPGNKLYQGIEEKDFYFVHSYHFKPTDPAVISGSCDYGVNFAASLEQDNIFATQFHPEKSQTSGLQLLANFMNYVNAKS